MPRALWKGSMIVAELSCRVALYAAASTAERVAFRTLNRATGHAVKRSFVDSETGAPVPPEAQVKGYEVASGEYVVLEPSEVAAIVPHGDKVLAVDTFIRCSEVDDLYFDKPYYVGPSDEAAGPAFAVLREAMRERKVAALARATLFRRVRTVLLRPHGALIIGHTLNFDYEVKSADQAFADIPDLRLDPEMLDLARHIIDTKSGTFDPRAFDDRYDAALAALVKAKVEGKPLPRPVPVDTTPPSDLLAALRRSAALPGRSESRRRAQPARSPARRKTG